jgi:hypothetical protein
MGQGLTKLDPRAGDYLSGLLTRAGEPANVFAGGKHFANAGLAFRTELFEQKFRYLTHIFKHARALPRNERRVTRQSEANVEARGHSWMIRLKVLQKFPDLIMSTGYEEKERAALCSEN